MQMHIRGRSASGSSHPRPSPPITPPRAMSMSSLTGMFAKMRQTPDRIKPNHTHCSSGDPQTHSSLTVADSPSKLGPYVTKETYVCVDAVNMAILLGATRDSLLKYAVSLGSNVLIDEQWKYTICSRQRPNRTFHIHVSYTASFAHSDSSDPHKPVALDQIKSIPGCMTIHSRTQD